MEVSDENTDNYCLVCGGKITKKTNKNKYRCASCGEIYDLEEFETFEIEMPVFDKLLLHSLKKKTRYSKNKEYQINEHERIRTI